MVLRSVLGGAAGAGIPSMAKWKPLLAAEKSLDDGGCSGLGGRHTFTAVSPAHAC